MALAAVIQGLPRINGEFEIGIAASTDPGLSHEFKLCIGPSAVPDSRYILQSAHSTSARFTDPKTKRFVINAAVAVQQSGWLASFDDAGRNPDGDWYSGDIALTDADITAAATFVTAQEMKDALTVIVATKITWWMTNHHTGQGGLVGYVKKVANAMRILDTVQEAERIQAIHMAGHWVSTREVLHDLGISGITRSSRLNRAVTFQVKAAADLKLRVESLPAGTHRHGVAAAAIRRIKGTPLLAIFPDVQALVDIVEQVAKIRRNPVKYHVGAVYLCGSKATGFTDTAADSVMGRLGTYVHICLSKSTLAKSPHIAGDAYMSCEDYSPAVQAACAAFAAVSNREIKFEAQSFTANEEQLAALNMAFDGTAAAGGLN